MGPSSPHSARVRLAECCWGSSFYQPRVNLSLGGFELTILLCLPSTGITHAPLTASGVTVILVWRSEEAEMEKYGFKLKWWHLGGDLQDNNGILGWQNWRTNPQGKAFKAWDIWNRSEVWWDSASKGKHWHGGVVSKQGSEESCLWLLLLFLVSPARGQGTQRFCDFLPPES